MTRWDSNGKPCRSTSALSRKGWPKRSLRDALIGLGSAYRVLGECRRAVEVLGKAVERFPENGATRAFLAMALYNTGEHRDAVSTLLRTLAETTQDEKTLPYKEPILFYASHLDEMQQ